MPVNAHPQADAIMAAIRAGLRTGEIVRRFGVAESTAKRYRKIVESGTTGRQDGRSAGSGTPSAPAPASPPPRAERNVGGGGQLPVGPTANDVREMEAAAREGVTGGFDEDGVEPIGEVWRREESRAAVKIRKAAEGSTFRWRAPGAHLLLSFVSDQHIAPGTPVDFKAMREDAELIRSTPNCYAVLGGDGVDNHVKHKSAMLHARSTPEDQFRLFEHYLTILGDKSLLMVSGNHENWTSAFAGVDVLGRIAKDRRLCYAPDEAFLEIAVGTQAYRVATRHQYRMNSTFNQVHAVKQWLRLGEREFDIGCVGHHHEHAVESFVYRGKVCWGCRPGSYQITSAYSRQYGFNQSMPTCPTFLLRGDRREIVGFTTLRSAVDFVGAARQIGVV